MPRSIRPMPALTTLAFGLALALAAAPARAQFEDQSVQAFREADRDGDQALTREEFRVFIETLAAAGAPMSIRIRTFGAYGLAFRQVDGNGDGLATPEELRAAEAGG